jgi:hypothetical protein
MPRHRKRVSPQRSAALAEAAIKAAGLRIAFRIMSSPAFPDPMPFSLISPSVAQMTILANSFGLECHPCSADSEFTARFIDGVAHYNALAPPELQVRYIWHELAESICRQDNPGLFDQIEPGYFDGAQGLTAGDVRHRIAKASEKLLILAFPSLDAATYARIQSARFAEVQSIARDRAKPDLVPASVPGVDIVEPEVGLFD